jgi:hypothetical protein
VRAVPVVVASLATGIVCACSLISTAGLSGEADAPGEGGATDTGTTATNEAGRDGATLTGPDGAVVTPFVCPANAILCDDFERDQPGGNVWQVDGTFPVLSNKQSLSPTKSFVIGVPSNGQWNHIRRRMDPVPPRVRLSFGLYASSPLGDFYEIVKLPYGAANNWETFTLALRSEGLIAGTQYYDSSPSPMSQDSKTAMSGGALYGTGWHAVDVDIDMRNNPRVITVTIDGTSTTTVNITSTRPTPTSTDLLLGVTYSGGSTPFADAYVDNVVLVAE